MPIQPDFSVDDGGMDEYDVADEHQNLFENLNIDNMGYEELLALQERIGFVNKGLPIQHIEALPVFKYGDLRRRMKNDYSKKKLAVENSKEEEKKCIKPQRPKRNESLPISEDIPDPDIEINFEEEGMENCNEDDEERKEQDFKGLPSQR